jgi:hypothetical protein
MIISRLGNLRFDELKQLPNLAIPRQRWMVFQPTNELSFTNNPCQQLLLPTNNPGFSYTQCTAQESNFLLHFQRSSTIFSPCANLIIHPTISYKLSFTFTPTNINSLFLPHCHQASIARQPTQDVCQQRCWRLATTFAQICTKCQPGILMLCCV